jgi:hypothetical protein
MSANKMYLHAFSICASRIWIAVVSGFLVTFLVIGCGISLLLFRNWGKRVGVGTAACEVQYLYKYMYNYTYKVYVYFTIFGICNIL